MHAFWNRLPPFTQYFAPYFNYVGRIMVSRNSKLLFCGAQLIPRGPCLTFGFSGTGHGREDTQPTRRWGSICKRKIPISEVGFLPNEFISIFSFKYHHFFTALQSSTFCKVLQLQSSMPFFLHWAFPEGVLWLSFPSLFWKTSTAHSKFSTWKQLIKSSGKLQPGATVMFPWCMFCTW